MTLQDEIEDAVDYARSYLSLESTKYRKVWYLLHVCPDAAKWPSVLVLCELVFSLPFSNGKVEQIFSSLKLLKTANRTTLRTSTLDDLLEINIEGPPMSDFSPTHAIDLWWRSCRTTRRTKVSPRHEKEEPKVPDGQDSSSSDSEEDQKTSLSTALDNWDKVFL